MAASRPTLLYGEREALAFLEQAFGGKPDDCYVVLWELAGRQSNSFLDLGKAAAWVNDRDNAYIHVGLVRRSYQGGHRPKAVEIDGIVGVWSDLDVADPVHKKEGLPPTDAAALRIAAATGLTPSIVVHSGHGVQAWWLLNEPWIFDNAAERQRAATLARAWDLSLRARAGQAGYTLDAVGDLSRLLRIPGTRNTKGLPLPVRIESSAGHRYSLDDIEAALVEGCWERAEREMPGERTTDRPADDGDLTLNPAAEPPKDRMFALCENDPRFLATWNRTRRGNDVKGWTASEYDLALARYAALASWTRQEIANLMIASRRKHGDDLKLRQDYYTLTIDRATADQDERNAVAELVGVAEEAAKLAEDDPTFDRSPILRRISAAIGVDLRRVLRSKGDPPVYSFDIGGKVGVAGSVAVLLTHDKFRVRVAELAATVPNRMKNDKWDPIAQALVRSAEIEDLGIESTAAGHAETLISLYLGDIRPAILAELDQHKQDQLAYTLQSFVGEDGRIRIFGTGLRRWLGNVQALMMTPNEVGSMLRAYGAEPETMHLKSSSRRTTRAVWVLPEQGNGIVDRRDSP